MKPTLSLSAAEAPARLAPTAITAAVVAMRIFLIWFLRLLKGWTVTPVAHAPHRARRGYVYRSGTNTVPRAAGAVEPPLRAREIRTRTMTVARYGNADMNCEGTPTPQPCACNCRIVTAPNR